jgi:hypothetical protein
MADDDERDKKDLLPDNADAEDDSDKTPAQIVDAEYIAWVERVRKTQADGRSLILKVYDAVRAGYELDVWRRGPWKSFEESIDREFGIHPQRYAHLHESIMRFGRAWVTAKSFEGTLFMLRLPAGSASEKRVIDRVEELEKKYGRPPSPEAIDRLVRREIPSARPVRSQMTETDRLRAKVRELEKDLTAMTRRAVSAEQKVAQLETRIEAMKAKKPLKKSKRE